VALRFRAVARLALFDLLDLLDSPGLRGRERVNGAEESAHDAVAALAVEGPGPLEQSFALGRDEQVLLQPLARAVEANLDGFFRQIERIGDLERAETFDETQHRDDAQARRQRLDRALERGRELLARERRIRRLGRGVPDGSARILGDLEPP